MVKMLKEPYSFYKTAQKMFWAFVDVTTIGLAIYFTKEVKYITLVPFLVGMRDFLKHRNIN
jgi:hypothetical protein